MENIEVLKITAGSRLFGLNTPESDFDYVSVYINPDEATNPSAKTTTHIEDRDNNCETVSVELMTFLRALPNDLKYMEIVRSERFDYIHPDFSIDGLVAYAKAIDMTAVYIKEINRRYNKTWFAEINPKAKNFNSTEGYDSKFAAHLYRVLYAGSQYGFWGDFVTQFGAIRKEFLMIRAGEISKDAVFKETTTFKEDALHWLNERIAAGIEENPAVPVKWYFQQALQIS